MFSSLASFIFGSTATATATTETKEKPDPLDYNDDGDGGEGNANNFLIDENQLSIGNTIEVTSRTPSVTGANPKLTPSFVVNSRPGGKNKNKCNKNNHYSGHYRGNKKQQQQQKSPSSLLLLKQANNANINNSNNKNFIIGEIDDEDWVLLEKENNEEELPLAADPVQLKPTTSGKNHQRNHQSHHSVYSGHNQHHHYPLKSIQSPSILSVSTYNTTNNNKNIATTNNSNSGAIGCDVGPTQSLYVVSSSNDEQNIQIPSVNKLAMEESWFLTPPPCFTSTGPVNMEISPFENLLIEHPSMSVYHSIRSAQETTESFVNIDLGVEESHQQIVVAPSDQRQNRQVAQSTPSRTPQHRSCNGHRANRFTSAQIKQELLARNTQKSIENQKRQSLCRNAIMRSNKVREFCSNGNRPRRSDLQHCRLLSRANNNRKC